MPLTRQAASLRCGKRRRTEIEGAFAKLDEDRADLITQLSSITSPGASAAGGAFAANLRSLFSSLLASFFFSFACSLRRFS